MPARNPSPDLKPRPLRSGEILWDIFPITIGFLWVLVLLIFEIRIGLSLSDLVSSSMLIAFVVPIGNSILMQFTGFSLLRRITQLQLRESLWLSEIRSRPFLLSQFKLRAYVQSIPVAVGLLSCVFASVSGLFAWSQEQADDFFSSLGFGAALIYALFSMQLCGFCAGFLGHLNRLRSLLRPNHSELSLYFISLKWITLIALIPFVILFLGIALAELAADISLPDEPDNSPAMFFINAERFETAFSIYALITCTLLNLFFCYRLSASWKKAQVEFFTFE